MELIQSRQQGLFLFDHTQKSLSFRLVQGIPPQVSGNPHGPPGGSLGADLAGGNLSDALGRGGRRRGVIMQGHSPAAAFLIHVGFGVSPHTVSIAFVNDQQAFDGTGHKQTLSFFGAAAAEGNTGLFPDHICQAGGNIAVVQVAHSDPQGPAVLSGRGARGQRADGQQQEQGQHGSSSGDPAFEACQPGQSAGQALQTPGFLRRRREAGSLSDRNGLPVGQGKGLLSVAADPAGGRDIKNGQKQAYRACREDRHQIRQDCGQTAARRGLLQQQQHIPGHGQPPGQVKGRGQKAAGPECASQHQADQKQDITGFSGPLCCSCQHCDQEQTGCQTDGQQQDAEPDLPACGQKRSFPCQQDQT